MKRNLNKINELIANSKNILIVSHCSPDEDAVGSALALKFALAKQGIESSIFISSYSSKDYKFLPGSNLIKSKLDSHDFDLVFALDYGNVQRLDINDLLQEKNPIVITIDHHLDQGINHIGEIKILESSSSTSEIIYYYLKESNWPINKNIATCLLTGIVGDTGGFIYSNTSHQTLLAAGDLLSQGIEVNKVIKQILTNNTLANNSKALGQALSRIEKYPELGLVYLIVDNNDFESWYRSDSNNLSSTINMIDDCKWSLLLVEYKKGKTKASLRSKDNKGVDVSEIAGWFGGGGHRAASGFRANKNPKKVLEQVIKKAKKVLKV